MNEVYDPLDYDNLARSVVNALLEREPEPLSSISSFEGSGVYALYYNGDFKAYSLISGSSFKTPIYVGKAIPTGGRKGRKEVLPLHGNELFNRLQQHVRSIEQAENITIESFYCRYLVVLPVWINLAEQFLVNHFKPLWNMVLEGFGNHDPGKGRKGMKKPKWDIVHPGRPWALELREEENQDELLKTVEDFLSSK
ncbi:MAG: Eco29kI family restriction endonuclease [bacterium]